MDHFYGIEIEWTGSRGAQLKSGGLPALEVAPPPEFQGRENTWTPEHLYTASVASCFMMTSLAIAENSKLELVSFSVEAKGKLEKVEGAGYQITEITLQPRLVVRKGQDVRRARQVLEKGEKNCFISNSIKTKVKLEPQISNE